MTIKVVNVQPLLRNLQPRRRVKREPKCPFRRESALIKGKLETVFLNLKALWLF